MFILSYNYILGQSTSHKNLWHVGTKNCRHAENKGIYYHPGCKAWHLWNHLDVHVRTCPTESNRQSLKHVECRTANYRKYKSVVCFNNNVLNLVALSALQMWSFGTRLHTHLQNYKNCFQNDLFLDFILKILQLLLQQSCIALALFSVFCRDGRYTTTSKSCQVGLQDSC